MICNYCRGLYVGWSAYGNVISTRYHAVIRGVGRNVIFGHEGETPPTAMRFTRDLRTNRFLAVFLFPLVEILHPTGLFTVKIVNRNNESKEK